MRKETVIKELVNSESIPKGQDPKEVMSKFRQMYKKMSVDDLTEEYSFRFGKEIHIDFEDIDRQLHLRLLGITKGVWSKQDSISYMNGYLKAMYDFNKLSDEEYGEWSEKVAGEILSC